VCEKINTYMQICTFKHKRRGNNPTNSKTVKAKTENDF